MPMLDQLIREIVSGQAKSPHMMRGGARLEWNATDRVLSATRLNKSLPSTEITTFERFIREAGLTPGKRREISIFTGGFGDRWTGVAWHIAAPSAAPDDAPADAAPTQTEASTLQASLFDAAATPAGEETDTRE